MRAERFDIVLWTSLVLGAVASAIVCALVATQSLVVGSQAGGWFYGYHAAFSPRFLGVFLLACAAGALLWLPPSQPGRREWPRVLLWCAAAIGVQVLLRSIAPYTLESLFTSDGANGFYGFAKEHAPADLLSHFNRVRRIAPLHAQANMPGKVMLVYALGLLTASPPALAWLVAAVSALGGLLIYALTRDLLGDPRTALFAAILYWCYPARIFFLPGMNTVTPVLVLGCACLFLRWLRTGRTVYPVAFGLALYLLVFFEPTPLVIGLLFAALAARAVAAGEISANRWVGQACLIVVTFIAATEAVHALTGFDLVTALRQTTAHATAFNQSAGRPYAFWVVANLPEFLFGIGVCQAFLFAGVLLLTLRHQVPIRTCCLGLLAVLLVTDLIGINRGEVIRLWIFLGAFFQIPAAYACAALPGRTAIGVVAACTLLQATLGTAMIGFVVP